MAYNINNNQPGMKGKTNKKRMYLWFIVIAVALVLIALAAINYYYSPVNVANPQATSTRTQLTDEEKIRILNSLAGTSSSSTTLSDKEKIKTLNSLSANNSTSNKSATSASSSSGLSDEEKMKILQSLSKQ